MLFFDELGLHIIIIFVRVLCMQDIILIMLFDFTPGSSLVSQ